VKDHPDGGPSIAHSVLAFLSKLFNWYAVTGRNNAFQNPIARGMSPIKPKQRAGTRVLTRKSATYGQCWTKLSVRPSRTSRPAFAGWSARCY